MIDPDISTQDALALLSVPVDPTDRLAMDRRRFLQLMGYGVGAGAVLGGLGELVAPDLIPGRLREAWAGNPIGPTDGILVLIGEFGGSDGLNKVVPYTNSTYYQQHGSLAIPAAQTLKLNASVGLHPNLTFLKGMYDAGEVAVVQGVGYPNPDLSHFSSMAYWMYGKPTGTPSTGWIGRWLDGIGGTNLFKAATIGQDLPLHLVGDNARGIAIPQWGVGFGGGSDEHDLWMYDAMRAFSASSAGRGPWHDALAATMKNVIEVGQEIGPVFDRDLPEGDLEKKLTVVARLINSDLGLRVIDTGYGGFDTHSSQPAALNDLMTDFDRGLRAFFTTLDDRFRSRVTIMTYSEFGRTSWSNDSDGTDHGTVNNHFVIGQGVKGGLLGAQPSLTGLERWDRMDHSVDFRSMYASVLNGWMGGGASTVLGASYPALDLFKTTPGGGVTSDPLPPSVLGDFVGVTPYRVYDSRTRGRKLALGAGTTGEVQVTGQGGVPLAGVTALALNVTAVGASESTSFTIWPTGAPKPDHPSLIAPPARGVPNLVIVKAGQGGRVNVLNDLGSAHCIVDVIGYFRTTVAARMQPLTPTRVLDTRNGTGGRKGALPHGGVFDVQVAGVAGVPANVDSVIVNTTAVASTGAGYLTVWPSGQTRPVASSVNFVAGQVIPNMVIAKVGTNGKISVFNYGGDTNVLVDVLGYLSPTAPGRYFPIAGTRVLDTRSGAPVGAASTRTVTVQGITDVPASGVSAVAINIAAYSHTLGTYITAWPNGQTRPVASNLNPTPGVDVLNMAIVKVGTQGKVQIYNHVGSVHLVVDVVGYFTG